MPDTETTGGKIASMIPVAGQIIGAGINAFAQGAMNKKTRKWNEKMYAKQRADSLADWNMQNAYNSPEANMARLRKAGLNPNLVYGTGSATQEAGSVPQSNTGNWNPKAPQFDVESIASYIDTRLKEAQIDNMVVQNGVLQQEKLKKAAETLGIIGQTESTKFDLEQKKDLKEYVIEAAGLQNLRTAADIKVSLDANERAAAMQAPTFMKAIEEILTHRMNRSKTVAEKALIQQQIHNLEKDAELKSLDIKLKKAGIQPGDPMWMRMLAQFLSGRGGGLSGLINRDAAGRSKNNPLEMTPYQKERWEKRQKQKK